MSFSEAQAILTLLVSASALATFLGIPRVMRRFREDMTWLRGFGEEAQRSFPAGGPSMPEAVAYTAMDVKEIKERQTERVEKWNTWSDTMERSQETIRTEVHMLREGQDDLKTDVTELRQNVTQLGHRQAYGAIILREMAGVLSIEQQSQLKTALERFPPPPEAELEEHDI